MSNASGKLVIIGIVAVALAAAGTSWWFRYTATHRAAQFWGPEGSRIIRDAPIVLFTAVQDRRVVNGGQSDSVIDGDVTSAPGMTHLRNALLEDRSFDWPASATRRKIDARYSLQFRRKSHDAFNDLNDIELVIFFSEDFDWASGAVSSDPTDRIISCRPIAKGLRKMFEEFTSNPSPR